MQSMIMRSIDQDLHVAFEDDNVGYFAHIAEGMGRLIQAGGERPLRRGRWSRART
jgi:hypothetical protein